MDIKPIETVYNGYRFRSRLEARWAVFFDTLGIKWEYEFEGFDLGKYGWYLPDFWLPSFNGGMFCEVKPDGGNFSKAKRLTEVSGKHIWFCEGVPGPNIYKIYEEISGEFRCYCGIPNWDQADGENRMFAAPCCFEACSGSRNCGTDSKIPLTPDDIDLYLKNCQFQEAVLAARSARFEHGAKL